MMLLQKYIILSICIAAAYASGEFNVLSYPKSLDFKGDDVLQSDFVDDVLYASAGYPTDPKADWGGLHILNPFNPAKRVVAVLVEGTKHLAVSSTSKTYPLDGTTSARVLDTVAEELEQECGDTVCDIDFTHFDEAVITYRSCFGDQTEPTIAETEALNPILHTADKQFLQAIAFMEMASDKLNTMGIQSNMLFFRMSLEPINKSHGPKSAAWSEANKLVSRAIGRLNAAAQKASQNNVLVVAIASLSDQKRTKRDVVQPSDTNEYNLAPYTSPDFPIMFNIILWFMVAFFLSLLAICYAIGTMDPGRDSIIYRMTSTRMKKDN